MILAAFLIDNMAKKAIIKVSEHKPKHDCLKCLNGTIGAFNLIVCKHCITPQPNRNRFCIDYKKKRLIKASFLCTM